MTTKNQKRWGIVAVGILMFFITVIISSISGNKASFYTCVWIMVGYYGYKGDLSSIKQWMKWLIFINLGVLFLVLILYNDNTVSYIANSKMELAFGVVVMLIPKIILFFYCDGQLEAPNNAPSLEKNKSFQQAKALVNSTLKNVTMEDAYSEAYSPQKIQNNTIDKVANHKKGLNNKFMSEEEIYTSIYDEIEKKSYNKGLWIKLFAETDGDENKTKVLYIRQRFEILLKSVEDNKILENLNEQEVVDTKNLVKPNQPNNIDKSAIGFNKALMDVCFEFGVDKFTAYQIINYGIKKYNNEFGYKNLHFKTLPEAINYARSEII